MFHIHFAPPLTKGLGMYFDKNIATLFNFATGAHLNRMLFCDIETLMMEIKIASFTFEIIL